MRETKTARSLASASRDSRGVTRCLVSAAALAHRGGMGMFDTIHLKTPLICPTCGAEIRTLQTKEFGSVMAQFKIGSVLRDCPVLTGIVKETLWCDACHSAKREQTNPPVYLVIWHSILAAVEQDPAKAEARLTAVDRLDLIAWLDEAQRETTRLRRHYYDLLRDVERWNEHLARLAAPESEPTGELAEKRRAFQRLFDLPEEILTAPDPLAAILARNKHADEEADD